MARISRLSLTDVLLKEGFITEEDLKKAEQYQRDNGGLLSYVLVKLGLVTEEQIVVGLAEQLGIPHMKLTHYKLDPEVVELLPERIIRKDKVIPLSQSGNTLTVATADPLNVLVIDDLKAITGCNIQTIVATPSEIEQVVGDYYSTRATMNLDKLIAQSEKETEAAVEIVRDEQSVDLDQLIKRGGRGSHYQNSQFDSLSSYKGKSQ